MMSSPSTRTIVEYHHRYTQFLVTVFTSEMTDIENAIQKISYVHPIKLTHLEDEKALETLEKHVVRYRRPRASLDWCYRHLSQFTEK